MNKCREAARGTRRPLRSGSIRPRSALQNCSTLFWHNIDPLTKNAQFCDHGDQYRTAIFYRDDEQRRLAEASKAAVEMRFKQPVYTEITAVGPFYKAEEYHQDYYLKNPLRYQFYRFNCGRDARLEELWGKKEMLGNKE